MSELITIIMTLIFLGLYLYEKRHNKKSKSALVTFLMLAGASLMWLVDFVEQFQIGVVYFNKEEAILSLIICGASLSFFTIHKLLSR